MYFFLSRTLGKPQNGSLSFLPFENLKLGCPVVRKPRQLGKYSIQIACLTVPARGLANSQQPKMPLMGIAPNCLDAPPGASDIAEQKHNA